MVCAREAAQTAVDGIILSIAMISSPRELLAYGTSSKKVVWHPFSLTIHVYIQFFIE